LIAQHRLAGPTYRFRQALVLASLLLGIGGCSGKEAPRRPNLVLVTLDTVRADHLGCYGDRAAVTPWLDRLAGEGVRFATPRRRCR
jgi:hypothetical protein